MIKIAEAPTGSGKTSFPAGAPFVTDSVNPHDFNLPHDRWRPHQLETLLWLTDGMPHTVVALVKTKSLQKTNYDEMYHFDAHYGRANFSCVHPSAPLNATCADCLYLGDGGMQACDCASDCYYLISKRKAMYSKKASLNYAYWMTATNWRTAYPPGMLYCDEAHNLSDIVIDWTGATVTEKDREEWSLPDFPILDSSQTSGILIKRESPIDAAISWLEKTSAIMSNHCDRLERDVKLLSQTNGHKDALFRAGRLNRKIGNALNAIQSCSKNWFILSGPGVRHYKGKQEPAFIVKALTARNHALHYFAGSFDTVMMSATIGNPQTFTEELGIPEYEYKFRSIPNQWPPECRPIHILDTPRMKHTSTNVDYIRQASAIARAVKSVDPSWCGFIHVTRKAEARLLAERLAHNGLQDRVWVPPGAETGHYVATDKQITAWQHRKRKVPNSLCISWSFWEGIDGLDERINIVAKVPFAALGDKFERARLEFSPKMYAQRAAWLLEQGNGRNRRGREQDYDIDGQINGLNCIADGNWTRVENYLSQSTRESIVK